MKTKYKIDYPLLSVNQAWKGRRFKTKAYNKYENALFILLPKIQIPKNNLKIYFEFGFSNSGADIDNPVKLLLDILQKKYNFNDNKIYELSIRKNIVKKGDEYFSFKIDEYVIK